MQQDAWKCIWLVEKELVSCPPPEGNMDWDLHQELCWDSSEVVCTIFISWDIRSQFYLQGQWQSLLSFHLMCIFCYTVLLHSNTSWLASLLCDPMIIHFLLFLASAPHIFSKKRHMLLKASRRCKHWKKEWEIINDSQINCSIKHLFSALPFSYRIKVQIFKTSQVTLQQNKLLKSLKWETLSQNLHFFSSLLNLLRLFLTNLRNPKLAIIHSPQPINIVYSS